MPSIQRRQVLASALFPAAATAATEAHEPARMGLHGMALFGGRDGLYASHLPMFHTPHDVQLLLRIRCQDAGLEARLRRQLAERPRLWTLEPERFDLSRLHAGAAEPLRTFGARLVEGHFERDGVERVAHAALQVESLLLFNRLLPEHRQQAEQRFFWFGAGREQFLVKWLDQRPDIDLIGRFVNAAPLRGQRLLSLPAQGLQTPEPGVLMKALRQAGARPQQALHWIYTETADLA